MNTKFRYTRKFLPFKVLANKQSQISGKNAATVTLSCLKRTQKGCLQASFSIKLQT